MANWRSGAKITLRFITVITISAIWLSGCASTSVTTESEALYIKASELTKLSIAVEAKVRYSELPENISDQELLTLSTEHDPSLLTPFKAYTLKVNKKFRHAIVLVCNQEGTEGLLEDAGCSAPMDKHLWKTENNSCDFTLSAEEICKF